MVCPKCHGPMETYNRNGVQIEQCGNCRGIFLDYGELEALTRLEGQWAKSVPPQAYPAAPGYPQAPAWGAPHHGGHHGGHHDEHYDDTEYVTEVTEVYEDTEYYEDRPDRHGYGRRGGHDRGFGHMLFSS